MRKACLIVALIAALVLAAQIVGDMAALASSPQMFETLVNLTP